VPLVPSYPAPPRIRAAGEGGVCFSGVPDKGELRPGANVVPAYGMHSTGYGAAGGKDCRPDNSRADNDPGLR